MSVLNTNPQAFARVQSELSQSFLEVKNNLLDIAGLPDANSISIISKSLNRIRETVQVVGMEAATTLAEGLETLSGQLLPPNDQESAAQSIPVFTNGLKQLQGYLVAETSQSPQSPLTLVDTINAVHGMIGKHQVTCLQLFRPASQSIDSNTESISVLDDKRKNIIFHFRMRFRRILLSLLHDQNKANALTVIGELMTNLQKLGGSSAMQQLWRVAAGFVEQIKYGGAEIGADVISTITKLDQEISRMWAGGLADVDNNSSETIMRSMLFYIGDNYNNGYSHHNSELIRDITEDYDLDYWFGRRTDAIDHQRLPNVVEEAPVFQESLNHDPIESYPGVESIASESVFMKIDRIDQIRRNMKTGQQGDDDISRLALIFDSLSGSDGSKREHGSRELAALGKALTVKILHGQIQFNANINDYFGLLSLQMRQFECASVDDGSIELDLAKWQDKYDELVTEAESIECLAVENGINHDQIEELNRTFDKQSESVLSKIRDQLTQWRDDGPNSAIIESLQQGFSSLKDNATTVEHEDIYHLCQAVENLIDQEGDRIVREDPGMLNLLEEMHDGLTARFGMVSTTSKDHVQSLTRMVALLLGPENRVQEEVVSDGLAAELVTNSKALLVTVGEYKYAVLVEDLGRVMRIIDDEITVIDGQQYFEIGNHSIPIINFGELWGEIGQTSSQTNHTLILVYLFDRVAAFEVDKFEPRLEAIEKLIDGEPIFVEGYAGVLLAVDQSFVPLLSPHELSNQIGLKYNLCPDKRDLNGYLMRQ